MLLFKRILNLLLAPGTIIFLLLGVGLLKLLLSGRSKSAGRVWLCLGLAGFWLFSTALLPGFLLSALETQYDPLLQVQELKDTRYIAVLSAGCHSDPQLPPASQLDESNTYRVNEGVRLFYALDGQPTLIMSGHECAPLMVALARSLGVPAAKLLEENRSMDTNGNAREVRTIVQEAPFLLVTSAVHMPRTMKIFQQQGMKPRPAPTYFRNRWDPISRTLFPNGRSLASMEAVVHEYLGLAYLHLFPARGGR